MIALKAGVEKKIPFFFVCFELFEFEIKYKRASLSSLPILKPRGLLRDLIATTYSVVVGFIRNPNAIPMPVQRIAG